jgi:hypothetical protein
LNALRKDNPHEIISFPVPNAWKFVEAPALSNSPLLIDDSSISQLHIDFIQKEMFPLGMFLPIHIFYSAETFSSFTYSLDTIENQGVIEEKNGIFFFTTPLFVRGVSRSFLNLIKNRLELVLFPSGDTFTWSIEPQGYSELAQEYASQEKMRCPLNSPPEEYFIDLFQKYLHSIRFYQSDDEELQLQIEIKDKKLLITPKKARS